MLLIYLYALILFPEIALSANQVRMPYQIGTSNKQTAQHPLLKNNDILSQRPILNLKQLFAQLSAKKTPENPNHAIAYAKQAEQKDVSYDHIAMIVEPRRHPLLEAVIRNVNEHVGWPIILFHGTENQDFIEKSSYLAELIKNHQLILHNTGVKNFTIKEYNQLMLSPTTWQQVPAENILLFQTDVIICGNNQSIQPFLTYDYVGAPWSTGSFSELGPPVGNGGLSFRKRSAMIKATTANHWFKGNEDVIFGNLGYDYNIYLKAHHLRKSFVDLQNNKIVTNPNDLDQLGLLNIPQASIAAQFSAEKIFFHDKPFGVHNITKYYPNKDDLPQGFLSYCPDVQILYRHSM